MFARANDGTPMSDVYQFVYFGAYPPAPNADADADGVSNFDEMVWGTNPTNGTSRVTGPETVLAGSDLRLSWLASPYRVYELQSSTSDLASWQTVAYGAISNHVEHIGRSDTSSGRFYRLKVALRSPAIHPTKLTALRTNAELVLSWSVDPQQFYELQVSEDLTAWRTLSADAHPPHRELLTATSTPRRFYRLKTTEGPSDTNHDGIADWEEALYQQALGHPLDSRSDTDSDGLPDIQEFQQGYKAGKKDHPAVGLIVFTPLEK